MNKTCYKCGETKEDMLFVTNGNMCKKCKSEYDKEYRKNNKNKITEYLKEYYENNKEELKEYSKNYKKDNPQRAKERDKQYYENNKEEIRAYKKIYNEENKETIAQYNKNYRLTHSDQIRQQQKKYQQDRLTKDPIFKLKRNVSILIRQAIKKNNSSKNRKSILDYLPYTIEELKEHIEKQFQNTDNTWMTWENHGRYNPKTWDDNDKSTWTWQIDHIRPHSTFQYTSMEDRSFKDCWVLDNLRPYSAKQNVLDGTKRTRHSKGAK